MRNCLWFLVLTLVLLGSCNNTSIPDPGNQPNPTPNFKPLGLLEVTLDLQDAQNPIGTANFKPLPGINSSTRTMSAAPGDQVYIKLRRRTVGFLDDNENLEFGNPTRYVRGTFEIANFTSANYNNLTFFGANVPTATLTTPSATHLGTMFSAMRKGDDALVTDTDTLPGGLNTFRNIKPSHGMRPKIRGLEVDPNGADMQVFSPSEANTGIGSVQSQLSSLYPGVAGARVWLCGSQFYQWTTDQQNSSSGWGV